VPPPVASLYNAPILTIEKLKDFHLDAWMRRTILKKDQERENPSRENMVLDGCEDVGQFQDTVALHGSASGAISGISSKTGGAGLRDFGACTREFAVGFGARHGALW